MQHPNTSWFAAALLSVALAACGSPAASPTTSPTASATIDGEVDSLDEARLAWANAGIPSYDFTISRQCFCMESYIGPFTVQVRDGLSTVTRRSDGSEVDPLILDQLPLSAEELFAFVEERQEQASFRATYDQATGLPLTVWSDPIPEAADDELGIEVSAFTAAP